MDGFGGRGMWEDIRLVAYDALLSLVNHCRYLSSIHGIQELYCLL
jgi:hypothetical protein